MHRRIMLGWSLLAALGAGSRQALAHEPADPKYGGQVLVAAHLDLEIVQQDGDLVIYVEDHGDLVPTEGAHGTLHWQADDQATTVHLAPAGPNRLVAAGVRLAPGGVAAVDFVLQRPADVSFGFKVAEDGHALVRVRGERSAWVAPDRFK